ncbi:hypothetical protein QBC46DRAFT_377589 [Diplogelasinospora grovesii]|uniref:Uncharacterized protein n=1 Tax=Diplogelasinospora grovesii TaxID=303347 RepID=A0AAN6NE06_9PEZI|nr:hypothetical protein QBC46DRAFT_377589 [Diplogelasinospora grovesii]
MSHPLFLSPALPSELLTFIIYHCSYPTTLIICPSRADFLTALSQDVHPNPPQPPDHQHQSSADAEAEDEQMQTDEPEPAPAPTSHLQPPDKTGARKHHLLSSPLYQVAVARHIRMVFIPTVTHLRAFLSVFSPEDSNVPLPPPLKPGAKRKQPLLLIYGLLDLHRDTSEWSAQGLSNTASLFVEAAKQSGFRPIITERKDHGTPGLEALLAEKMPILSGGSARKIAQPALEERAVDVRRVLGRWFRFEQGIRSLTNQAT